MALNDFIYRLKAMPGDATPHDELAVSGDLGAGITAALVDRGAGDVAWRFSAGATSIAIPANVVDMLASGTGATMALTLRMVNSGTVSYRTIVNVGPDVLPLAHASANSSPGFSFARHGSTSVRATGSGIYTNNITSGTEDRTYVIRFSTGKSTTYELLEIWANDPANPSTPAYIASSIVNVPSANSATWDTLTIDCSSGIIVEIKDLVIWPDEKIDAECSSLAANGIRGTLDTAPDTTAPTFTGTMTENSVTGTSYVLDWSGCVRTDDVGITGYQTSTDNSTWTDRGNVTSYEFTGLSPSTAYTRYVRAKDAAGNFSTSLSKVTTTTAADATLPVHTGSITQLFVNHESFEVECPVATDNVAVAGYEASIDGGTNYIDLGSSRVLQQSGLAASTAYPVRMRAYDTSGNRSTPALALTVTTSEAPAVSFVCLPLVDNFRRPYASVSGWKVFIQNVSTGALLWSKTGQSTNSGGLMVVAEPLATSGTSYRLIFQHPNGSEGMQILAAV